MKFHLFAVAPIMLLLCSATEAAEFKFSTATGWPFLLVPQISLQDQQHRYYINYKMGLDDGFSLGYEWQMQQHVYGVFAGALGARKVSDVCNLNFQCDTVTFRIFDNQTTQGVGVSYEYRFSRAAASGWAARFEVGYGKESITDSTRADGNVQIVYHY